MNSYELTIKRELIQTGAEKILLVDSSKFGLIKPWFITDLEIFDRIITDTDITQEWVEIIEKKILCWILYSMISGAEWRYFADHKIQNRCITINIRDTAILCVLCLARKLCPLPNVGHPNRSMALLIH